MHAFELDELAAEQAHEGRAYFEFLRSGSMSVGVYRLPAAGTDGQEPHAEDELYYVLSGRAVVQVGEEERPVKRGSFVFVGAEVPHHFHSIDEDLSLLVFFAPAETRQPVSERAAAIP